MERGWKKVEREKRGESDWERERELEDLKRGFDTLNIVNDTSYIPRTILINDSTYVLPSVWWFFFSLIPIDFIIRISRCPRERERERKFSPSTAVCRGFSPPLLAEARLTLDTDASTPFRKYIGFYSGDTVWHRLFPRARNSIGIRTISDYQPIFSYFWTFAN